jgi:hypothetical protein
MTEPPCHALATGRCLCGAIRWRAGLPALWVAHCHCTMCQRAHGAGVVTWVGVREDGFALDDPEAVFRIHESSPGAKRGFCARCGSPFLFRSTRWPGEVHLARASFETPLAEAPQAHVFHDTHVDWLQLGDTLPRTN